MSVFSNFFHVKQAPILSMLGFGGGGTGTTFGGPTGVTQQATGGDQEFITPGNGYAYHTFTTTGPSTFTVTGSLSSVDLFMVGGGGNGNTGGGGAGALIYKTNVPVSAQAYAITVGAGGGPTGATFS